MGSCLSIAAFLVSCLLTGCGDGLTTQEAVDVCDIEAENKPAVTAEAYDACIACFEACGDECKAQSTSPETYACED